jgi:hypothetical protein
MRLVSSCCDCRGCSCQSSGGDVESSVSVSPPPRAHTPLKQKKFAPVVRVVVVTRRVLTLGLRDFSVRRSKTKIQFDCINDLQ